MTAIDFSEFPECVVANGVKEICYLEEIKDVNGRLTAIFKTAGIIHSIDITMESITGR